MRIARTLLGTLTLVTLGLLLATPQAQPQGFSPEAAAGRVAVPDGFRVQLVAAEPLVRQPVAIEFDDRGRLWVVQYLQYPNPAGLKRVKVDRYSRTVYDRVPEPPPRGPRGDDRITILEDVDAAGRARKAKDFVTGLNLASGIAFGHGGVFVLQAPYLLFYPDRNRDDVPDGDPEVLLSGFGMEDASSVANSLTWGPDGWLYGCQGSTVTAHVRGVEFQQGVWRYHPQSRRFELFCEGGGNCWGLDFDAHGNLLYSTNVGGFVACHGVQGGYYWKFFGKHGALHNPYAYGYIDHIPHRNAQGGHVTAGGIVYQGDSFPARFRGTYIAANVLGHAVYWSDLERWGSSFRSAHGGELLRGNDTWFAPDDVTLGPDGSVYIADWYDKRTAHPDPDADWDKSNGRIYKIEARGTRPAPPLDVAALPTERLIALLSHPNDWYVRKARRVLADRRDPAAVGPLRDLVLGSKDDHLALEALWGLYVSGGFDERLALRLLDHHNPDVRRWAVRFLGDDGNVSPATAHRLAELAASDPDVTVRSQLASTAKRLPSSGALPVVARLVRHAEDANDPHIPLLLWWAVEHHAVAARERVLDLFASPAAWKIPLARDAILGRLMRRYAADGSRENDAACARLLASAPTAAERAVLLASLDLGLRERTGAAPGRELAQPLAALWTDETTDVTLITVRMRLGSAAARERALALVQDRHARAATRLALLQTVGEAGGPEWVPGLLRLLGGSEPEAVQAEALADLRRFNQDDIAAALCRLYPRLTTPLRTRARDVLLGRKSWALAFLRMLDRGTYPATEVPVEELRRVALYHDGEIDALVRKHWGTITGGTPEEKLADVRRLNNDLRAGPGDPRRGRESFLRHCATCHRLFGEGHDVGPDLTHANRKDRDFLLVSIVDPSAVIRREFLSYTVQTTDGRLLTGLIGAQSANSVTLVGPNGERTTVLRDRIEEMKESPVSLMPEGLLKDVKPQELRDLFSYLQADPADPASKP